MHPNNYKILDFGLGSGELAQELQQRRGYRLPVSKHKNNSYLKDQSYLFLSDTVFSIEVIKYLPNV